MMVTALRAAAAPGPELRGNYGVEHHHHAAARVNAPRKLIPHVLVRSPGQGHDIR
jgi:hypothetical protein